MFLFYLSAQELASQDEKLLLMESSLKASQEQLTEQIAETFRQEENSRKPQAELKTVTERIIASEEEKNDYKWVVFEYFRKFYFSTEIKSVLLTLVVKYLTLHVLQKVMCKRASLFKKLGVPK